MKTLDNFIDKIISEYEKHLKKGNSTLGTLPNDWKTELNDIVYSLCEKQKEACYEEIMDNFGSCIELDECDFMRCCKNISMYLD